MFFRQKNQQRLAFVFSIFLIILGLTAILNRPGQAQSTIKFDDFFLDKALRINFYMAGNAREEEIIIQDIYQEDIWPESRVNLTNPFNYGHYFIKVYEVASNQLIYAKGFDCQFGEYKTTTPALDGVKKVFQRAVRIPWPKRPVRIVFEARDRQNLLHPLAVESIDPEDYHHVKETVKGGDYTFEVIKTGPPSERVDLAFLAEGYTAEDRDKFVADVKKFSSFLFEKEPYKSNQNKFNIYGVFRTSLERGMDEPRQKAYKNTALKASFNAFDLDRYMLTEEGFALREMAAQVPYDAIVVLVNSTRYGGGGIYNDYCITTVDHQASLRVFIH
ncbi:MAG TPA: M64 family metallopeptidase, partial [Candidatus Saccharicenans sp.]|nr:M64 family metallopeptidase [Candidatus Saccharicenans sp.]